MTNREYIRSLDNVELFELFFYHGSYCDGCPGEDNCEHCGCWGWLEKENEWSV